MIRTSVVNLTEIPAVAFRQKLTSGGSGVTILRYGAEQPGVASISKTSGRPIPVANCPAELYPETAFAEALALTAGMPYRRLGTVRVTGELVLAPDTLESEPETLRETAVIIDSEEYQRIVDCYTDRTRKLNYDLLNRDFIQTAHSSGQVRLMIEERATADEIRTEIVKAQLKKLARNPTLTEPQIGEMIKLLDEVSPKSVFRPLNDEIRKWLRTAGKRERDA